MIRIIGDDDRFQVPLMSAGNVRLLLKVALLDELKDMPIVKWPCGECAFSRATNNPANANSYVVCGWWDDRGRWPLVGPGQPTEAVRTVTWKQAYGPHSDDPQHVCAVFSPKPAEKEAADGQ